MAMAERYDIVVIGAGPAGLAAATEVARGGATVLLLDDQPAPGGQVYRAAAQADDDAGRIMGQAYLRGRELLTEAAGAGVEMSARSTVWWADPGGAVAFSRDGTSRMIRAQRLIVASGSMERPAPVPGWTLPGAMTAGGAQALLKSGGLAARDAVFAGTGPLLYLVAAQYLRAGFPPRAVLDATPGSHYAAALRFLPGALRHTGLLATGLRLVRELRRAGVPVVRRVDSLRILGTGSVEGIRYERRGRSRDVETAHVFLHLGVAPDPNLALALGCDHFWHAGQRCWHASTDGWGRSSLPNVFLAGDGAAIGGAIAAEGQGRLAAWRALCDLGHLSRSDRDRHSKPVRARLAREKAVRPFLDRLFLPPASWRLPDDPDSIVCRCEAVPVGEIRRAVGQGARGLDGLKSFTRCGMGPCQGRLCGVTVAEILARESGLPSSAIAPYRARFPLKPVALEDMASLDGGSF
jgi:thioredoxin reductase/bacterioferritin-associated ferredoxin